MPKYLVLKLAPDAFNLSFSSSNFNKKVLIFSSLIFSKSDGWINDKSLSRWMNQSKGLLAASAPKFNAFALVEFWMVINWLACSFNFFASIFWLQQAMTISWSLNLSFNWSNNLKFYYLMLKVNKIHHLLKDKIYFWQILYLNYL